MAIKVAAGLGALLIVAMVASMALLGGDDEANATDGAFIAGMKPHHEAAIEMAEIARERAEHPEIEQLADEIIAAQSEEIELLDDLHQRLFGMPIGEMSHGSLGLPDTAMGMGMDAASLETADPFDRAFIDMMIPHHQGAIRMARIELQEGGAEETQALAEAIIEAQSSEIEQMNQWRTEWYGEPSPAGGVPDEDEPVPASEGATESMEH